MSRQTPNATDVEQMIKVKLANLYHLPHLMMCPVCDSFAHSDVYLFVNHVCRCCHGDRAVHDESTAPKPCSFGPQCVKGALQREGTVGYHEALHHSLKVDCLFCPTAQTFTVNQYVEHTLAKFGKAHSKQAISRAAMYVECLKRVCGTSSFAAMSRADLAETLKVIAASCKLPTSVQVDVEDASVPPSEGGVQTRPTRLPARRAKADPDETESDTDRDEGVARAQVVKVEYDNADAGALAHLQPKQHKVVLCPLGTSLVLPARQDVKVSSSRNHHFQTGLSIDNEITANLHQFLTLRFGAGWTAKREEAEGMWTTIEDLMNRRVLCVRSGWELELSNLPATFPSLSAAQKRSTKWSQRLADFNLMFAPSKIKWLTWQDVCSEAASESVLVKTFNAFLDNACNARKRDGMTKLIAEINRRIDYGAYARNCAAPAPQQAAVPSAVPHSGLLPVPFPQPSLSPLESHAPLLGTPPRVPPHANGSYPGQQRPAFAPGFTGGNTPPIQRALYDDGPRAYMQDHRESGRGYDDYNREYDRDRDRDYRQHRLHDYERDRDRDREYRQPHFHEYERDRHRSAADGHRFTSDAVSRHAYRQDRQRSSDRARSRSRDRSYRR
jgi:hypothetical protein